MVAAIPETGGTEGPLRACKGAGVTKTEVDQQLPDANIEIRAGLVGEDRLENTALAAAVAI